MITFSLYEQILAGIGVASLIGAYLVVYQGSGMQIKTGWDLVSFLVFGFLTLVIAMSILMVMVFRPSIWLKK